MRKIFGGKELHGIDSVNLLSMLIDRSDWAPKGGLVRKYLPPDAVMPLGVLAPVSSIHHMVNGAWVLDPQLAWNSFEENAFPNSSPVKRKRHAVRRVSV